MSTESQEIRELRVGRYIVADDEPCKILSIDHSKPGKHGAAKARIEAMGLWSRRRTSIVGSVTDRVQVPIIEKRTGQVLSIQGNTAQVMDLESYATFEALIPEPEVANQPIEAGKEIQYIETMGRRVLMRI